MLKLGGAPVPPSKEERMKIKFTGNVSVAGNHYEEGTTADLDKEVANDLISMGELFPLLRIAPSVWKNRTLRLRRPGKRKLNHRSKRTK